MNKRKISYEDFGLVCKDLKAIRKLLFWFSLILCLFTYCSFLETIKGPSRIAILHERGLRRYDPWGPSQDGENKSGSTFKRERSQCGTSCKTESHNSPFPPLRKWDLSCRGECTVTSRLCITSCGWRRKPCWSSWSGSKRKCFRGWSDIWRPYRWPSETWSWTSTRYDRLPATQTNLYL